MQFDVLTIFPELFASPLREGILRKALAAGKIVVGLHNIRDYAVDRHKMTDDRPFGGGEGMVMKPEPLTACLQDVQGDEPGRVILLSPRGRTYNQQEAVRLAGYSRLILICGRYEGVDERFTMASVDEEISIGDFILTGGELAAMALIDSITRLLPGVLGCSQSAANDTFSHGLLKHSQYTRPREFNGLKVPGELLSGNHEEIARYRFIESVRLTLKRRPEMISRISFAAGEYRLLKQAGLLEAIKSLQKNKGNNVQTTA